MIISKYLCSQDVKTDVFSFLAELQHERCAVCGQCPSPAPAAVTVSPVAGKVSGLVSSLAAAGANMSLLLAPLLTLPRPAPDPALVDTVR